MKGFAITFFTLFSLVFFLASCGNSNPASVAKPGAPTLSSPANEAVDQPTTATLTWSTISAASSYHVQVSSSNSFSPLVAEDSSLTTATKNLTGLLNGTTYYWRVRAKNSGGVSDWTDAWHFTVINAAPVAPGAPTLNSPANNAVDQPATATLTWSTIANATAYDLQVSSTNDFSSLVAEKSSLSAATATVSWLVDNTTYFWRVRAKNDVGTSDWTAPWSFTVVNDSTFFEFGRSQGYSGYWAASDPTSQDSWLYYFSKNTVVISIIHTIVSVDSTTFDTVETYRGVFTLDSSVTPHAMDIHLTTPQYASQTIQTIYALQPVMGSFVQCNIMLNDPGAARPTYFPNPSVDPSDPNLNKFLPLKYQWTHN